MDNASKRQKVEDAEKPSANTDKSSTDAEKSTTDAGKPHEETGNIHGAKLKIDIDSFFP